MLPPSPTSRKALPLPTLKSCTSLSHLKQLHALSLKTVRITDPLVSAELVRLSAAFSDLPYARRLLSASPNPNSFSFNTLLNALPPHDSLLLFLQLLSHPSLSPNSHSYPPALVACSALSALSEGKQIHAQVLKLGLDSDAYVATNLVRVYAVCGEMRDAGKVFERRCVRADAEVVMGNVMVDGWFRVGSVGCARGVFEGMERRTVVSWNGMIAGLVENGLATEALGVFERMQEEGVRPNYVTLVSVLPAVARVGDLGLGKWVHVYAARNGIEVDDVLGSALVDMYAKCGNIEKAMQVFEGLPKRNVVAWSSAVNGLAMHGMAEAALGCFERMRIAGVPPSDVVFIGVLNACSHAGFVERGRAYFEEMVGDYGLEPRIEHYGCMVDMLGRIGLLHDAKELLLKMPIEPDDVILKALLGHCRIHGDIEMGTRVANRLMEVAPNDSGSYVLLSNLYASVGDWNAVAKVRLMMKELNIRKDPGSSCITVDGMVHEFVVEDDSHPRTNEIYSMLEEMSNKLKSKGHVPVKTQVLLNIGEEEKESLLTYHSEKIAVAFGLISTKPGTTLQIAKNLRVCGDCHSSLKLISEIYNRRIVVRDRSRFHHFENGSCSCKDFW